MGTARKTPQNANVSKAKPIADQKQVAKGTSSEVIFRSLTPLNQSQEAVISSQLEVHNSNVVKMKLQAKPSMTLLQQLKILIKQKDNVNKVKSFLKAHENDRTILIAIDNILPKLEKSHPVRAVFLSFKADTAKKKAERDSSKVEPKEKLKTSIKTDNTTNKKVVMTDYSRIATLILSDEDCAPLPAIPSL